MSPSIRIAVLTAPSPHAWIIVNALVERFGPVHVLAEEREGRLGLIRKRMKRLGSITVLGQIGFVGAQKLIERRARGRIAEIVRDMDLNPEPSPACEIYPVGSVNSMACRAALAMVKPDVVLVIGTRIIRRETLAAIKAPVINVHMGWTPKYRGQAGGYWALAMGDKDHAGVTLHLVDEGVDTGAILYQERFEATAADSFPTYFYIQAGVARQMAVDAVEDAAAGRLVPVASDLPSQQFYHPTLWFYLRTALASGVW